MMVYIMGSGRDSFKLRVTAKKAENELARRDEGEGPEGTGKSGELPPAARRALAEAEARRRNGSYDPALPPERNGRKGPEPIRYGDWEKDGIVSDF